MAAVVRSGGRTIFVRRNASQDGVQRWLALGNSHGHSKSKQSKAEEDTKHPEPPNHPHADNLLYLRYKRKAQELRNGIDDVHYEVQNELDDRAHYLTQKSLKYTQGMMGIRDSMDNLRYKVKQYRNTMRNKFKTETREMMKKLESGIGYKEMRLAEKTKIPAGIWADAYVPAIKREIDEEYAKWMKGRPPPPKRRKQMTSEDIQSAEVAQRANPYWAPDVTEIYKQGYSHGYTNATGGMSNGLKHVEDLKEAAADTWIWTEDSNGIDWYTSTHLEEGELPPKPFMPFTEKQLEKCMVDFGPKREDVISKFLASGWLKKRTHKLVKPVYEWTDEGIEIVDSAKLLIRGGGFYKPAVGELCTNEELAEIGGNMGPLSAEDGVKAGFLKRVMKSYELQWSKNGAIYMLTEERERDPNKAMPKTVMPDPGDPVTEEQLEWIEDLENADVDIEAGIETGMWREIYGCSCREYCPEKRYRVGIDGDGIDESLGKEQAEWCEGPCDRAPRDSAETVRECTWEGPEETNGAQLPHAMSPDQEKLAKSMGLHDLPPGFMKHLQPYLNEAHLRMNGGDSLLKEKAAESNTEGSVASQLKKKKSLDYLDDVRNQVIDHYY